MHKSQYIEWIRDIFNVSDGAKIEIFETQAQHKDFTHYQTTITIYNKEDSPDSYVISKPLREIIKDDIKLLKRKVNLEKKRKLHPVLGPVFRFIAWWFAFTGLYSMVAVCPFCGQAGCAVGAGSAGVVGGFLAFLLQYGKATVGFIKNGVLKFFPTQRF